MYLDVYSFSNPSTYVATLASVASFYSPYVWLKLVDDGTNISLYRGVDRNSWELIYTVSKASSYLGASGFNYLGAFIENYTSPLGTTISSWTLA
jgi:hypothetical protein